MKNTLSLACLMLLAPSLSVADEVLTPAKGSPERKALLGAIRPSVEQQPGAPVEFVVNDLKIAGGLGGLPGFPHSALGAKRLTRMPRPTPQKLAQKPWSSGLLPHRSSSRTNFREMDGARDRRWIEGRMIYELARAHPESADCHM
jgi:hypothetical protein